MGLSSSSRSSKTYVNIIGGKFAIKTKEGTEGAVSRVNKNKETVWEKIYDSLTGVLLSVKVERNEGLKSYQYTLEVSDVGDMYYVNIPCESRYGDSLATKLPKLEKNMVYTFMPYEFQSSDMKNIGIAIYEGTEVVKGQGIKPHFTKEEPNGMPVPKRQLDEDEYKAYQITKRKFLRDVVAGWDTPVVKSSAVEKEDDLPF